MIPSLGTGDSSLGSTQRDAQPAHAKVADMEGGGGVPSWLETVRLY